MSLPEVWLLSDVRSVECSAVGESLAGAAVLACGVSGVGAVGWVGDDIAVLQPGVSVSDKAASGRNVAQESVKELLTRENWDEWARSTWEIATSGTRPDWGQCGKCGSKVKLDRVDLTARVNAAEKLQAMGYGKPRDESESSKGFVLNRTVVLPAMSEEM